MAFNPLIWKGFDLSDKAHEQLFMSQLADLLNALNSAQGLANLLNGKGTLGATALSFDQNNLGTITTNQTVDLSNAARAFVFAAVTTVFSPTISLINVAPGTEIQGRFVNSSGSTVTLKILVSDPAGAAYAVFGFATGAITNLATTGVSVLNGIQVAFKGTAFGSNVDLLYVLA